MSPEKSGKVAQLIAELVPALGQCADASEMLEVLSEHMNEIVAVLAPPSRMDCLTLRGAELASALQAAGFVTVAGLVKADGEYQVTIGTLCSLFPR